MSRANKNIRHVISGSRSSMVDRAKSSTNLQLMASMQGKITKLKSSQAVNQAASTYHNVADDGIKLPGLMPSRQSLGRIGQNVFESVNKPPIQTFATAPQVMKKAEGPPADTNENQVTILDDRNLDDLSIYELKRHYMMLGRECKNKIKTVMALQNNFSVVSKLC